MFKTITAIMAFIVLFSISCTNSSFAGDFTKGIITVYDVYIPPNDPLQPITLQAKFERKGKLNINPDVENEVLSFYVDGTFINKSETKEDGFANVTFQPSERKHYTLTVKLEESKEYRADEGTALIYAISPQKPTIIVDIDNTVSITQSSSLILKNFDDKSQPLKDAPQVLTELEKRYNIIFVTAREDALLQKTRSWLKGWQFPSVPVFYADFGQTSFIAQGKYKDEAVAKIKKDIKNIVAGIGDKEHDAKAYIKNGLKAIIITDGKEDMPEGTIKVKNWLEIKRNLAN